MSSTTTPSKDEGSFTVIYSNLTDNQVFGAFMGMLVFVLVMVVIVFMTRKARQPSMVNQQAAVPKPKATMKKKATPSKMIRMM